MSDRSRTIADLLADRFRDIAADIERPGGLDAPVRDLDFYDAWAARSRATRIYGYTPWEAAVLEHCVIHSGTFRFSPNPLHELYPGIPKIWLHSGGPHGTDERLVVKPGRSCENRIRDFIAKTAAFKRRGVLFYVKSLCKSQYGFPGIQTAAYSSSTCKSDATPVLSEKVIRLRRA